MARPHQGRTLESLEGKLGTLRHELRQVLRSLKREIAKREAELLLLRSRYQRGQALLQGKEQPGSQTATRKVKRASQIDWKRVFTSLPPRFTLDVLIHHPEAGRRPKSHLYAVISRWKKEKKLAPDRAGGYRKLGAPQKAGTPRPKSTHPRPAAQPEQPPS